MLVQIKNLVIINNMDYILRFEDKYYTHVHGLLHRAVSVFIFNDNKDLIIQQRSFNKYHSSLLWSNTCCSHPNPYETYLEAAHRCLFYEMGFDCFLTELLIVKYNIVMSNGMIENELNHLFLGYYNKYPNINSKEVLDFDLVNWYDIKNFKNFNFSGWFNFIINNYYDKLTSFL